MIASQDEVNAFIDWINNQTQNQLNQINLRKEKALKELSEKYATNDKISDSSGIIAIIFLTLFAVLMLASDLISIFIQSASKARFRARNARQIQRINIKQTKSGQNEIKAFAENLSNGSNKIVTKGQPIRPRSFPIKCKPKSDTQVDASANINNNQRFESSSRNFVSESKVSIQIN